MMAAKEHAVALGNLSSAATQALRRQHGEFQPVLRINLAVLSTARDVANSLVSTVAKAAGAKNAASPTTYGARWRSPFRTPIRPGDRGQPGSMTARTCNPDIKSLPDRGLFL